jgi:hypothetical protein
MQTLTCLGLSLNIYATWEVEAYRAGRPSLCTLQHDSLAESDSGWAVSCPMKEVAPGQNRYSSGLMG